MKNSLNIKTYISYGIGGFGHDVLYAVMSTYLMTFLTTQLFGGKNAKWVVVITTTIMVLRIIELLFFTLIGGVVDNTRTKIGKFKPWILIGGFFWSISLLSLFTNFFNLPTRNPLFYVCLFAIVYLINDFAFSFKDASYWGMMSAIAIDSNSRTKLGTVARIGSTAGQAVVMIAAVPVIKFFSGSNVSKINDEAIGNQTGWFFFAVIATLLAFITCIVVSVGTKESNISIRKAERFSLIEVFKVLAKNDQLMWIACSYIFFNLAQLTTQILLLPYFTYIVGNANLYSIIGVINLIVSFISVSLFPVITKYITRKKLYIICICLMIVGLFFFLISGTNTHLAYIGYIFFQFPYPMLFLCATLTITDTVEYGQLKNGQRAESTTVVVRTMCDVIGGAVSNGVIGLVAILCGIHEGATALSVASNPQNLINFKILMVGIPFCFMVISAFIYKHKVKMSEKLHAQIVLELEKRAKTGS